MPPDYSCYTLKMWQRIAIRALKSHMKHFVKYRQGMRCATKLPAKVEDNVLCEQIFKNQLASVCSYGFHVKTILFIFVQNNILRIYVSVILTLLDNFYSFICYSVKHTKCEAICYSFICYSVSDLNQMRLLIVVETPYAKFKTVKQEG